MKKYQIIYADPPWKQEKGGKKKVRPKSSGEKLDYQIISLEEIEDILFDVLDFVDDNSILFLWIIDKYLFEAQKMADN